MKFKLTTAITCAFLAGCSGNPFEAVDNDLDNDGVADDTTGIVRDGSPPSTPPGTRAASANDTIVRSEARSETEGNGFAEGISYDSESDTFTVDGLAFDGDNVYSRGRTVSDLGTRRQPYAVYEADQQTRDPLTGAPVNQFTHRAIYGVSRSGNTEFAIVRTGAYIGYGFGGFIYQRTGGVELPDAPPRGGDAVYTGKAAGLRDRQGIGGLEYSRADLELAIDFDDFNENTGGRGDAVRGRLSNRQVFDIEGNDITGEVIARINSNTNANLSAIPAATFLIGPGAIAESGEIQGELTSQFVDREGNVVQYETGNYYAIISGDEAREVVGIVVLQNDAERPDVTIRDTSGFIVYR